MIHLTKNEKAVARMALACAIASACDDASIDNKIARIPVYGMGFVRVAKRRDGFSASWIDDSHKPVCSCFGTKEYVSETMARLVYL